MAMFMKEAAMAYEDQEEDHKGEEGTYSNQPN